MAARGGALSAFGDAAATAAVAPAGHLWTIGRRLVDNLRPPMAPPSRPWSVLVDDAVVGPVTVHGRLSECPGAERVLVVVHGLGGSAASPYAVRVAAAAVAAGWSCLRLDLRGSGESGEDFYHAGLTDDLAAAVASPELARYGRIDLLGVSLGGHVALSLAVQSTDPRLGAVVAISAPLDLAPASAAIDGPRRGPYRHFILRRLKAHYRAVALRRHVPTPVSRTDRIRRLREWDELTVAPRFGFAGAADYYERASVGPRLDRLARPGLYVGAAADPLIPEAAVRERLAGKPPALEVRWAERGGHVGFPSRLDLGLPGALGLEGQVVGWLASAAAR